MRVLLFIFFAFVAISVFSMFLPEMPEWASGDCVAVVNLTGPIYESDATVKTLNRLSKSENVKGVVLRIDSPGGAVGASEEIARAVTALKRDTKKPVIASFGNVAASGGYYIAVAADEIYANNGSITGSIGVIASGFTIAPILERAGVSPEIVKSGEHKDTGSPLRERTDEDRALLQSLVYDLYRQFFREVLRGRHKAIDAALARDNGRMSDIISTATTKRVGMNLEQQAITTGSVAKEVSASLESETALRGMADGRVFTGEQALALGLVDKIGSLDDAIREVGKRTGLGVKPKVIERSPMATVPSLLGQSARMFWNETTRRSPAARME